jgi:hypothetical protein
VLVLVLVVVLVVVVLVLVVMLVVGRDGSAPGNLGPLHLYIFQMKSTSP